MFDIHESPHYQDRKHYSDSMLDAVITTRAEQVYFEEDGKKLLEHLLAIRAIRLILTERLIGIKPS